MIGGARPAGSRIRVLELRSVRGTGGGPEKTILLGAAQADTTAFEIVVCYLRDRRDPVFALGERARRLGVDYCEIEERHSTDLRVWPALRRLVEERRIDIVHGHEYKTDLLAFLLARRTGAIPVSTSHGWSGDSWRERYLYYPADKRLLARFPAVIAVSSKIRDELLRHGARPDRVTVILNSIDPDAYRRSPEARERVRRMLGLDDGHVAIGAVGRLEQVKRFDLLLAAAAPVLQRRPGARLLLVGDGSLRAALASQAETLGIADRVLLLGHRDDAAVLYQAFDLFVQSSESEGTPNAVLEAMAMEAPIVATDVGGTRELAFPGEHAIVVPRHDVGALSAAMEDVLANPDAARQRAVQARARVESALSFTARTRRLEAIYRELIEHA